MRSSFGSFYNSIVHSLVTDEELADMPSESSRGTNLQLNKRHYLYAGVTGLWLLAAKTSAHCHKGPVINPLVPLELSSGLKEKVSVIERGVVSDSLSQDKQEEKATAHPISLTEEEIESSDTDSEDCPSPLALDDLSPSRPVTPLPNDAATFTATNAKERLQSLMESYDYDATYEDNFVVLRGAQSIFQHFLTLIWLFWRIELSLKSYKYEEGEDNQIFHFAEGQRIFVMRPIPLLKHFLPESINCQVNPIREYWVNMSGTDRLRLFV